MERQVESTILSIPRAKRALFRLLYEIEEKLPWDWSQCRQALDQHDLCHD
jgi:hypothetical protein